MRPVRTSTEPRSSSRLRVLVSAPTTAPSRNFTVTRSVPCSRVSSPDFLWRPMSCRMSARPKSLIVPTRATSDPPHPGEAGIAGEPHDDRQREREHEDGVEPVDVRNGQKPELGEMNAQAEHPLQG